MYYSWWMYISLINEWFLRSGVLRAANIYFCTKVFLSYNILSSLSRALSVDVCWLWMYSFSFLRSIQSITIAQEEVHSNHQQAAFLNAGIQISPLLTWNSSWKMSALINPLAVSSSAFGLVPNILPGLFGWRCCCF